MAISQLLLWGQGLQTLAERSETQLADQVQVVLGLVDPRARPGNGPRQEQRSRMGAIAPALRNGGLAGDPRGAKGVRQQDDGVGAQLPQLRGLAALVHHDGHIGRRGRDLREQRRHAG